MEKQLEEMSPQEKSQYMVKAIKFCLAHGLMSEEEVKAPKNMQEERKLSAEAILKMRLYQKKHPQEQEE